ncbi:hypothetical protein EVAR_35316_1 [Eumeta japonica]|uniref:Uncharacterized protein n=1 Tax=Eumeta variegata TaxID=151549 RepID=A0A4C1XHQ4_EUMVA|nr:hypothetical protein EVAR_35316_1 [Eumeta japonica]
MFALQNTKTEMIDVRRRAPAGLCDSERLDAHTALAKEYRGTAIMKLTSRAPSGAGACNLFIGPNAFLRLRHRHINQPFILFCDLVGASPEQIGPYLRPATSLHPLRLWSGRSACGLIIRLSWTIPGLFEPASSKTSPLLLSECCARGRPIIVEWERDAAAGLSVR